MECLHGTGVSEALMSSALLVVYMWLGCMACNRSGHVLPNWGCEALKTFHSRSCFQCLWHL